MVRILSVFSSLSEVFAVAATGCSAAKTLGTQAIGNEVPLESIMNLVKVGAGVALTQALGEPSMYRNKTCNNGCVDLARLAFEANRTMSSAVKSNPWSLARETIAPIGTK